MSNYPRKIIDDDILNPYKQYEYDGNGNPIYIGYNDDYSASDDDATWVVKKLTWSSGNLVSKKTRKNITWTDRATGW